MQRALAGMTNARQIAGFIARSGACRPRRERSASSSPSGASTWPGWRPQRWAELHPGGSWWLLCSGSAKSRFGPGVGRGFWPRSFGFHTDSRLRIFDRVLRECPAACPPRRRSSLVPGRLYVRCLARGRTRHGCDRTARRWCRRGRNRACPGAYARSRACHRADRHVDQSGSAARGGVDRLDLVALRRIRLGTLRFLDPVKPFLAQLALGGRSPAVCDPLIQLVGSTLLPFVIATGTLAAVGAAMEISLTLRPGRVSQWPRSHCQRPFPPRPAPSARTPQLHRPDDPDGPRRGTGTRSRRDRDPPSHRDAAGRLGWPRDDLALPRPSRSPRSCRGLHDSLTFGIESQTNRAREPWSSTIQLDGREARVGWCTPW